MLFERVYEDGLAHASFMIACQKKNTALVVDPRRDVSVYLDLAAKHGLTIEAVTETHIHADYLSGSRELAEATGATLYVSGEGGEDWQYGFEAERLRSGDTITLGNITVEAVHTPGHTPEHLTFLITDGAVAEEPGYMLTGDFVFVGDVGRPDLLDEAAGGEDTRFTGAKDLFRSLKNTFLTMPDYVQVFPAHGAGSPCGKSLGAVPSTTVGYERATAWWAPFVENDDEQGFIDSLLEGQPDAPTYFSRMKRLNKEGPALLGERHRPDELESEAVDGLVRDEEAIVVDPRDQHAVHSGTYPGSLNIPAGANASKFAAWTIDPDTEHRRLIIVTDDAELARDCSDAFVRVGVDNEVDYFSPADADLTQAPKLVAVDDLPDTDYAALVDVREQTEFDAGTIDGALHLPGGKAHWTLDSLPSDGPLVTFCQSGARNSVVSSMLRRQGFDVVELEGSYAAWEAARS